MSIASDKLKLVKLLIETTDEKIIGQVKQIFNAYKPTDFWDDTPVSVKYDIEESLKQLDNGEVEDHDVVMNEIKSWLKE